MSAQDFIHEPHEPDQNNRDLVQQLLDWLSWQDWSCLVGPMDQFIRTSLSFDAGDPWTARNFPDLQTAKRRCWRALSCAMHRACTHASSDCRQVGFELLDKYVQRLHGFMGCNREERMDGTQETLLCVLEHIHRVREPEKFLNYCRIIATRQQYRTIRAQSSRRLLEDPFDSADTDSNKMEPAEHLASPGDDVHALVEQKMASQSLWPHLATASRLTQRDYTILYQHFKLDRRREHIRHDFSLTQSALDVAIHRALKKLKMDRVVLSWR